ncbi:hypothetical protein EST38_g11877 [Candolleomyces aberdarensis]|uniref:Ras-GEF domain-containing protein n=1 Tax=Candolleomyces aberdarensis TaxID=2316362 RepID=A0A4V1Q262_9AGAR|nr:hypothetical protein EST38_g11877 [Candolleomyces aberdarensis]
MFTGAHDQSFEGVGIHTAGRDMAFMPTVNLNLAATVPPNSPQNVRRVVFRESVDQALAIGPQGYTTSSPPLISDTLPDNRKPDVDELCEQESSGTDLVLCIHGAAGIGKSTLAGYLSDNFRSKDRHASEAQPIRAKRTKKSDIWSLGMTFLELLTGEQPFSEMVHASELLAELLKAWSTDLLTISVGLNKDKELREVIITASIEFTTPEGLCAMLGARFDEAEQDKYQNPEKMAETQTNVLEIMRYWLTQPQLPVSPELLWEMQQFCLNAWEMKTAPTMVEKIRNLLHKIEMRPKQNAVSRTSLSPSEQTLNQKEITPQGLALALTLLEGDKFRQISPSDYLAHLCGRPEYTNVEAASSVNEKIVSWVKQSLVHYEALYPRVSQMRFFINTAKSFQPFLTPVDAHMEDLRSVLQVHEKTIEVNGQSLINVERYTEFMARVKNLTRLPPPDLERYRHQGQLAYLESKLADVRVGGDAEDELLGKARGLKAIEDMLVSQRILEHIGLGLSVDKQMKKRYVTG